MIRLRRGEFLDLVRGCYADLPTQILPDLDNLDVVVEDWPDAESLDSAQRDSPNDLLGLFSGWPRVERGGELPLLPDRITLFQRPIESLCSSKEDVAREVKKTLLHEVGHYLGLEEEELERLGYG